MIDQFKPMMQQAEHAALKELFKLLHIYIASAERDLRSRVRGNVTPETTVSGIRTALSVMVCRFEVYQSGVEEVWQKLNYAMHVSRHLLRDTGDEAAVFGTLEIHGLRRAIQLIEMLVIIHNKYHSGDQDDAKGTVKVILAVAKDALNGVYPEDRPIASLR